MTDSGFGAISIIINHIAALRNRIHMCGIVGVLNLLDRSPVDLGTLSQMVSMLRHRGPDGFGLYRDGRLGMGHARLSIIDLAGGAQPIGNEDGTLWIVFNGEIFNYVELRPELEAHGHVFSTHTDTEVILHLYEEHGVGCLKFLNGQFAIAIWDSNAQTLFLARDRLGVRPLFFTVKDGQLVFGSEIKSILAYPGIRAEFDLASLQQIFTYWSTLSPRTVFRDIQDIPPGHYLLVSREKLLLQPYWSMDFGEEKYATCSAEECLDELEALLIDATRIRLRADVPVGAYLSGGLDSSITTAIIRNYTRNRLDTFSIAFVDNPEFDESKFQRRMAAHLGTDHRVVECTHADIGQVFPDVIWHTETPVLRTSPAPMFLLSALVHRYDLKVVITGEGADEFLAGYDIFKEMKIRRFWARNPDSSIRPLLLRRLYPDITALGKVSEAYLGAFFKKGLTDIRSPYYSHAIRWENTARIRRFFSRELLNDAEGQRERGTFLFNKDEQVEQISLPSSFNAWSPLAQAQYLEISIFLSQYLLSSQGDRVAMAHSVEGRFPFLDYRVVEWSNQLPARLKLHGLTEKWLLKRLGRKLVPKEIWKRTKRPYRAPIHRSFFGSKPPDYVHETLSERHLKEVGIFNPVTVAQLGQKAASGVRLSEVDEMALVGILSTQLINQHFMKGFRPSSISSNDPIKVEDRLCRKT